MRKAAAILGIILSGTPTLADEVSDGKALAEVSCGRCHALGSNGESPFKEAPPFRTIHENYEVGELEDTFKQGIVVAHPAMPR